MQGKERAREGNFRLHNTMSFDVVSNVLLAQAFHSWRRTMGDVFDRRKRSDIMSKIKSKDTKYEVLVRQWLHAKGYRYRKNDRRFPGTPDIVFPKLKIAIFIHGCFWHGHDNCKYYRTPQTNTLFWVEKINANKLRDQVVMDTLIQMGWTPHVIWECQLKNNREEALESLESLILDMKESQQKS